MFLNKLYWLQKNGANIQTPKYLLSLSDDQLILFLEPLP